MTFRRILFWSHLAAGVSAAVVILLLAVTGVLLTYEVQITRWAESGLAVGASGGEPLPADRLAVAAFDATGGQVSTLVFENDPAAPVIATIGRSDKVFLDPYSGDVLGTGPTAAQDFFGRVTALHRWLTTSGRSDSGAAITGAANLVFGFLLLSGAWLWTPRLWKWGMLKTRILFRKSYPNAKARDFAWHHVFAFWAAIPLLLIIFSGIVISYPWASNLVLSAYGDAQGAAAGSGGGHGQGGGRGLGKGLGMGRGGGHGEHDDREEEGVAHTLAILPGGVGLQAILDTAEAHDPAWRRIVLTLPKDGQVTDVIATVDTGTGRQPALQETVTISQQSGEVVRVSGLSDRPAATRARMWLRFIHTGEVYGLLGQTIAGLASLASVFMVYTGLALSYRRLIRPLFRRRHLA